MEMCVLWRSPTLPEPKKSTFTSSSLPSSETAALPWKKPLGESHPRPVCVWARLLFPLCLRMQA